MPFFLVRLCTQSGDTRVSKEVLRHNSPRRAPPPLTPTPFPALLHTQKSCKQSSALLLLPFSDLHRGTLAHEYITRTGCNNYICMFFSQILIPGKL